MSIFLKFLGMSLDNIPIFFVSLFFLILLFLLIIVQFIGKTYKELGWLGSLILIPLLLVDLQLIFVGMVGEEYFYQIHLVFLTLIWIAGFKLLVQALDLFWWSTNFVKMTGEESPRLLRGLTTTILCVFTIYGITNFVFGKSIGNLLIPTGIVAGIIGLSLQSMFSNLFSSLAIAVEKPYQIGDWIEVKEGVIGKVIDITWRTTRVLSWNNSVYVVPNSVATGSIIHNFDLPEKVYALWFRISIDCNINPEFIHRILVNACLESPKVLKNPSPRVYLSEMSRPLQYTVYVYFSDFVEHWAGKSNLMIAIQKRLGKHGISPSMMEVHVANSNMPQIKIHEPGVFEYLKDIDIFKSLSSEDIDLLSTGSRLHIFEAGTIIIRQGDEGDSLFAIISGSVVVIKEEGDHEIEVAQLRSGSEFGEMSLLTGEKRSATVKAISDTTVVEVSKDSLSPLLRKKPMVSKQFTEKMVRRKASTQKTLSEAHIETQAEISKILNKIYSFFNIDSDRVTQEKEENENEKKEE
ncbi:cyclic nucleotide-binding domain-containing protein [Candidatus Uabimicrobium sp. HlEnr_7]|uniref:cyclic nucleotide-binding domain-containing protein n=1 Tax=Candidatus Uabimicrobium helgolandensis TaxID=3095367 RepID=UPI0035562402